MFAGRVMPVLGMLDCGCVRFGSEDALELMSHCYSVLRKTSALHQSSQNRERTQHSPNRSRSEASDCKGNGCRGIVGTVLAACLG